jgi:predicted transcriptional regulator
MRTKVGGKRRTRNPKAYLVKRIHTRPIKKPRCPAGIKALGEIRKYQRSTNLLIRRMPFGRLVRSLVVVFCFDTYLH